MKRCYALLNPPQTKQRHKRSIYTRDVNEIPLMNGLLAPESYLLFSTAPPLSHSSAEYKSTTKPHQTTRQHEKFYSKHRNSYSPQPRTAENIKIADTLRSNPRQYKNRPFSGRLYMPLQKREFYSFLRCFLAAFWACLVALARSREPVVALTVTSNLSR